MCQNLSNGNDNTALRVDTLRMSIDTIILA